MPGLEIMFLCSYRFLYPYALIHTHALLVFIFWKRHLYIIKMCEL